MRLAEVLDDCRVKIVTVAPDVTLAEATRAMRRDGAAAIVVEGGSCLGVLTAADILGFLAQPTFPADPWLAPVAAALGAKVTTVADEEPVGRAIERMTAAGIDHLPVAAAQGIVVVSLCRLVLAENALLHGEVQYLQNYIAALHDAPND
jgi:CBS domain-containing protein